MGREGGGSKAFESQSDNNHKIPLEQELSRIILSRWIYKLADAKLNSQIVYLDTISTGAI